MKKSKLFVTFWALVSLLLIAYTVIESENNRRVIGITEVEETTVSFPFPVEVSSVSVVPNQEIKKGDLLLELRSEELEEEITKIKIRIQDAEQKLKDARLLSQSDIHKLKAEKILEINSLKGDFEDVKIALENEVAIAASLHFQTQDTILNPKSLKLGNIQREIVLTEAYYDQLIKVEQLEFQVESAKLSQDIENLKHELNYNLQRRKELNVLALYDGYIKKVRVEKNTLMEAFTPLVTYSKLTPVYVRAYTGEQTRLDVNLGTTVQISSASRKWIETEGVVIAESKRITELPERLKIQPYSQEWGQEFLVKLPADNKFLIGEKVLIR